MNKSRDRASEPGRNGQRKKPASARRGAFPRRVQRHRDARRRISTTAVNGSPRDRTAVHMLEREHAIQRYGELFDFAPTGYVSFDRTGRISEINLTAVELFGITREHLIGMPFSVFVLREDLSLFLHHLLRCRSSEARVETELRLKSSKHDVLYAELCSTPITASADGGAVLYQTAIVDLTQRKIAEQVLADAARQQTALYQFARKRQNAKSLYDIYEAALDAISGAMNSDRASILLRDQGGVMRFVAWRGLSSKYRKAVEGRSPWKSGTKNPEPICMPDVEHAALPRFIKNVIQTEGIRAAVFIPLLNNRKLIGKFMAYYDAPHTFAPDELKLAATIGQDLIQAIQHTRDEEALRESEARMRATVEQATAGVARCDIKGQITFANQKLCDMLGYKESELIGKSIADVTHRDEVQINMRLFQQMISDGEPFEIEKRYVRKNGSILWADVSASAVRGRNGKPQSTVAVIVDITARKKAEAKLSERARLLDLSNDAIIVRDLKDRILYWNKGAERMYGYTAKEAIGRVTHKLLKTEPSQPLRQILDALYRDSSWKGELVHYHRSRKRRVTFSRWALDRDAKGNPATILETNTDITERKKSEVTLQKSKELLEQTVRDRTHELRVTNEELRKEMARRKGLEGEILAVSDREQQRLGQELHDGLCQHLTAVAFMARSVGLRLKNHRVIDATDIEKIAELVNKAAVDTRNLSRALHRVDVDAAGLIEAMQDLVDREIWRTPCRLEVKPSFRIDDDVAAGHLYRIAREAVINANKHAQARELVVKLERSRDRMVLRVIDNGVGLSKEPELRRGLGFHIMNYRAQLIGGRLEIDSAKGGGTRVSCYLPNHVLQRRQPRGNGQGPVRVHTQKVDEAVNRCQQSKSGASDAAPSGDRLKE